MIVPVAWLLADFIMVHLALLLVNSGVHGLVVDGALFGIGCVALLFIVRGVAGVATWHVCHVTL
jgi:hypothetical protein